MTTETSIITDSSVMLMAHVLIGSHYVPLAGTKEVLGNKRPAQCWSFILFSPLQCCYCRKLEDCLDSINGLYGLSLAFFTEWEGKWAHSVATWVTNICLCGCPVWLIEVYSHFSFLHTRPPNSMWVILYFRSCLEVTDFPNFFCIQRCLSFRHEIQNVEVLFLAYRCH